jgi:protein involved in polysaccharide export with SLBB domain
VAVDASGAISYPFANGLVAEGLTPSELAAKLAKNLAPVYKDAQVSVSIKESANRCSVLGEVASPGSYLIPPNARLTDIIALAGGPKPNALQTEICLSKPGQPPRKVNLKMALLSSDIEDNPLITRGQLIYVPEFRVRVAVLGEVNQPGLVQLQPEHLGVIQALSAAGGFTKKARRDKVVVITQNAEGREVQTLEFGTHLDKAAEIPQLPLKDGDIVFVPTSGKMTLEGVLQSLFGINALRQIVGGN